MRLSIVTTLYRSRMTIGEFYRRVIAAAEPLSSDLELIMVNDGSPDDSLDLALAIQKNDRRVVILDLSRNFGHYKAIMTGLSYADGDVVFLIDSDLEEEPELIADFYNRLAHRDCDVVYGVQKTRRGGFLERTSGTLFYYFAELLSDESMPRNVAMVRIMTRQYVRTLVRYRDREFAIAHLWRLAGFRQVPLVIEKLSSSPTTYSLASRIGMAVNFLTTTSTKLLHIVLYAGILMFGVSVAAILFYLVRYFTMGIGVDGYTSLIVSIWLLGGFITLALGIISIYIANILVEAKRRPYTVVREVYRADGALTARSDAARVSEIEHSQRMAPP